MTPARPLDAAAGRAVGRRLPLYRMARAPRSRYRWRMPPDAAPVLAQLNPVVADMAASVAFYRRLGLTIDDTHPWSAYHVDVPMPGGLSLDLDTVEFAKRWDTGWGGRGGAGQ